MSERLDIVISEKGGKTVSRSIENIGKQAERTTQSTSVLKRALGGLGIGLAIRQAGQLADKFTGIQNKLRSVSGSFDEATQASSRLFEIANKSRSDVEATVSLFARLKPAAQELNASQADILKVTEATTQAFKLSGASASETAGGVRQLAQALGSGVLRGDEFNSIAENAPVILRLLSKELGVNVAALRELASEGKLTSQVVFSALLNNADDLQQRFSQLSPTISDAFTVLNNRLTQFVGKTNEGVGASALFAQGVILLSNNLELMAGVITIAVIPSIVRMTQTWLAFAATNPAALLATIATAALLFGTQLKLSEKTGATFQDFFLTVFENLKEGFVGLTQTFFDNFAEVDNEGRRVSSNFSLDWRNALLVTADLLDGFRQSITASGRVIGEVFQRVWSFFVELAQRAIQRVIELLNQLIGKLNSAVSILNSLGSQIGIDGSLPAIPTIPDVSGAPAGPIGNPFQGLSGVAQGILREEFAEQNNLIRQFVQDSLNGAEQLAQKRRQLYDERIAQSTNANRLELDGIANIGNAFDEMAGRGRSAFDQLSAAGGQFGQNITNIGQQINNVFTNAFSSLENALVGFVTTGKFDFKSLINSMLADLARLVVQMLIIRPLMGMFGGFFGGIFGFAQGGFVSPSLALPGFATGGIVGGFGGSTSDNILARLSPGEFVMNAAATKRNRGAFEYINRTGQMPAMGGGLVYSPTINVEVKTNSQNGAEIGQEVATAINSAIETKLITMLQKQRRPGGILRNDKIR